MELALKIDVCTYAGMRHGVPALLRLLDQLGVRASFFVACGPDHSGRAIRRLFRRGFVEKMWRTRAAKTYGWQTLLYGTLLPGPNIARRCPGLLREILVAGHELAVHGYNHVRWQDELPRLDANAIRAELSAAWKCVEDATGHTPRAFGAPGWQCTALSFACEDEWGLAYHSDTRGQEPYFVRIGGQRFRTLEIPTTLPTLDETWGSVTTDAQLLQRWYGGRLRDGLNVYTAHAEMEGRDYAPFFCSFVEASLAAGARVCRLIDVAPKWMEARTHEVIFRPVAGRAGLVAQQGTADE